MEPVPRMEPPATPSAGFLGGLAGVVLGGLAWLVISGFVIGDPLIWGLALVVGTLTWFGARRALGARPDRWGTILGVVMLVVLLCNALLLDPIWDRLPERLLGMPTGRTTIPLLQIRLTLGLLTLLALSLIARDFRKEP